MKTMTPKLKIFSEVEFDVESLLEPGWVSEVEKEDKKDKPSVEPAEAFPDGESTIQLTLPSTEKLLKPQMKNQAIK